MRLSTLLGLLWIVFTVGATGCGKVEVAVATSQVRPVSGYAVATPLDAQGAPALTQRALEVAAYNPNTLLLSGSAPAVETAQLNADHCALASGCPYQFDTIDFARLSIGLLVRVGPPDDSPTWMQAYTWVADSNTTRAALDSNDAVPNTRSFALSSNAWQRLQAITGVDSATLQARGVMLGMVQGRADEAGSTSVLPPAIAGATVNTDAASLVDISYANDNADGPNTAANTGAQGVFVAVPKSARPVLNIWRVIAPTGDPTHRWAHSPVAGTFPGKISVLALPASANQ